MLILIAGMELLIPFMEVSVNIVNIFQVDQMIQDPSSGETLKE